jgi:hypothetical protein
MRWKNIDKKNIFKFTDEVEIDEFTTEEEFKMLVKKYHPDTKDEFLKTLFTKKMQKLLNKRKDFNG